MKNFIVGALIIGVAIVVGFMLKTSAQFGASSGPDYYNMQYFHAGATDGGDVTTLTSGTTVTITAAQVCKSSVLSFAAAAPTAASTTLPTAATMANECLRVNGESKTLLFKNTAANAASTTVIQVASTAAETLLMGEETGADVIIDGGNAASIQFIRTSASEMTVIVRELVNAD